MCLQKQNAYVSFIEVLNITFVLVLRQQLFKIYAKWNTFRGEYIYDVKLSIKKHDFNSDDKVLAANNQQIKT